ncbi:MAG: hypothetical protein AABW73_02325 [Nanoarchaeota archaeon]
MARKDDEASWAEFLKWKKDKVGENILDAKDHAQEMISNNPWKSLAISAAVGAGIAILIGSMVNGRRTFVDKVRDIF